LTKQDLAKVSALELMVELKRLKSLVSEVLLASMATLALQSRMTVELPPICQFILLTGGSAL